MNGIDIYGIAIIIMLVINAYGTCNRFEGLMNEITNIRHEIENLKDAINKD